MFTLTEIKYQLLSNRNRSVLTVCIAALLVCCMSFYLGSIQSGEAAQRNLAEAIPVTAQIVSRDGSKTVGFEIDEHHFDGIMSADIRDPVYTASACAIWQEKYRTEEVKGTDTSIKAISDFSAMVGLTEEMITFAEGWDASFLEGDDAVCVLSDVYAQQFGMELGDTIRMPFYVTRYNDDGFTVRFEPLGERDVQIIGLYQQSSAGGAEPVQMIVSIPWLKTAVDESGLRFFYNSFQCTLRDPMNLNTFKEAMRNSNFAKPDPNAFDQRHGDTLVVDDQLFIETAEKLEQNLKVLRWFLVPFFVLVIVLVTLVTFLLLRSTRRDMAIATSMGRPKLLSACAYFLSTLLADAFGCLIAIPVLLLAAGLTLMQILTICGLFLLCACVGIWTALLFLLRFDTLALLTKID